MKSITTYNCRARTCSVQLYRQIAILVDTVVSCSF